tara:strand:+ start:779 stop:973 length:195 start_codon:yes stop_codon:yes gene_type:complete
MSKKIKIELTEQQYFAVAQALQSHCFDIMGAEFISPQMATENRVISNAIDAMEKGHDEWITPKI